MINQFSHSYELKAQSYRPSKRTLLQPPAIRFKHSAAAAWKAAGAHGTSREIDSRVRLSDS